MKAIGPLAEGLAGYEAGRFNRDVARTNEVNTLRDSVAEEAQIRDQARKALGVQLAAQGSGGLEIGTGSAMDALTESAVNATLDVMMRRRRGQSEAQGHRVQGQAAYAQGRNAMSAGALRAIEKVSDYASAVAGG